ncbi:hypothetical protein [Fimbriiglobus ruber]|uniref:hypothetical protein n=1 Tax=Fimbriiglobus ruber TaxID=1908690 RepID=UPI000B4AA7E6|nr:hypothetical protein [Fimbriiglobus ruber]
MTDRIPITRASQLAVLNLEDMVDAYRDGYEGSHEPGNNRTFSFWHGWRFGAVDGRHQKSDAAQIALAHDVVEKGAL